MVVTLGTVVSYLKSSSLPICNVENRPGGAPGISAGSAVYVNLGTAASCDGIAGATTIYGYADANAAYAGAGFNGGSQDQWTVGNISVGGDSLSAADVGSLDQVMQSLGATKYAESS